MRNVNLKNGAPETNRRQEAHAPVRDARGHALEGVPVVRGVGHVAAVAEVVVSADRALVPRAHQRHLSAVHWFFACLLSGLVVPCRVVYLPCLSGLVWSCLVVSSVSPCRVSGLVVPFRVVYFLHLRHVRAASQVMDKAYR